MGIHARIQAEIAKSVQFDRHSQMPNTLAQAMEYAVFPGGARIRPTILMSVALACGDDQPQLTDTAACALELVHCASLVHDDLPCFDNSDMRRGKPTVHRAFGEPIAVLTGDSLIIKAFEHIALQCVRSPDRAGQLIGHLARYAGTPNGICAGQAWESEPNIDLSAYHRSKTGALFIAATQMGAIAAGQNPDEWSDLGAYIGEAFQVADDLRDVLCTTEELGKPMGQDALNDRPNAVAQLGVSGAMEKLNDILACAIASIPACPGEQSLAKMVRMQADSIMPSAEIVQRA